MADPSWLRPQPKLSDLSIHVDDLLHLHLSVEEEFHESDVALERYSFVPYALSGLAASMQTPAGEATRPTVTVDVPVHGDDGTTETARGAVSLYGPADVASLDLGQVVRRYPAPGTVDAEEIFHAHIEFDRPELPWSFSAQTRADGMRPWLALVVLEQDEVDWEPAGSGLLPVMQVDAACLPPCEQVAAWAHAQAAGGSASLSARLSTAHSPVNVSRLLAARILRDRTDYVACVVPTTQAGCNAGLGLPGGGLGPAWAATGTARLPVYDRWRFRTAPDGGFARLALRLQAVEAPWYIGRRLVDLRSPGEPLDPMAPGEPGERQIVRCALVSPQDPPEDGPSDTGRWSAERTEALREAVERPGVVEGSAGRPPGVVPDLPVIGPRLYARGQRGTSTVPAGDWFEELNTTPVHRIVAGLGTRVVQRDQEPLMQAAWAQVGEVEAANRALALAELARAVSHRVHRRLARLEAGTLLQVVNPAAVRFHLDGEPRTLAGQVQPTATPLVALGGALRRTLRPAGPIGRRTGREGAERLRTVVGHDGQLRDFTRPHAEPDGIGGLSDLAVEGLDRQLVAEGLRRLGVDVTDEGALDEVVRARETHAAAVTVAEAVGEPAHWRDPVVDERAPGARLVQLVGAAVRARMQMDAAQDVARARWVGGLAAALALADDDAAGLADAALDLERIVIRRGIEIDRPPIFQPPVDRPPVDRPPIFQPPVDRPPIFRPPVGRPPIFQPRPPVFGGGARPVSPRLRARRDVMLRDAASRVPPDLGAHLRPGWDRPLALPPRLPEEGEQLTPRQRLESFATPPGALLAEWVGEARVVTVFDVRAQLEELVLRAPALDLPLTPSRDVLGVRAGDVLGRLHPDRTVTDQMKGRLQLGTHAPQVFVGALIQPIMAAPRFDRPMYKALDDYDREWLVPGLGAMPQAELVTVLEANDVFNEAFLVGLSDEMGRELLWRGYPTDSRGTYFRRFWDGTRDELREEIHRFTRTPLGSHMGNAAAASGRAVVVVRGELVRRYPDLTVMAMKASGKVGRFPVLPDRPVPGVDAVAALFHASLPPDVLLAGLEITIDELRADDWWVVLSEHPQATRFERTERDADAGGPAFSVPEGHGGAVAAARLADPSRVAFEADLFFAEER